MNGNDTSRSDMASVEMSGGYVTREDTTLSNEIGSDSHDKR